MKLLPYSTQQDTLYSLRNVNDGENSLNKMRGNNLAVTVVTISLFCSAFFKELLH